uniref:DNA replication complex GINS protein PSF3 isoform X1 n=1 Tax=Halichoerus grypus TaxID=9711 RepID=UPI00165A0158|nr:DNA replication complex GINS protein PSF3 isoform X1 [Halichoerus grypus]
MMTGSKLELPLWLTKGLFDNKRRILSVELPKIYQQGWRTVFSADANVVDLHKLGPHFYGFGSQLLHFDSPENADISQSLLQGFEEHEMGCLRRPAQGRLWNHAGWWGDWEPKETRRCQNSENHKKNEKTQASLVCSWAEFPDSPFPRASAWGEREHPGGLGRTRRWAETVIKEGRRISNLGVELRLVEVPVATWGQSQALAGCSLVLFRLHLHLDGRSTWLVAGMSPIAYRGQAHGRVPSEGYEGLRLWELPIPARGGGTLCSTRCLAQRPTSLTCCK